MACASRALSAIGFSTITCFPAFAAATVSGQCAEFAETMNTASMSGHIVNTPQNQVAYNTSKAGIIHMTRTLAAEWAARGIRMNSISPGYTRTALVENLLATPEGKSMLGRWLPMIPMNRMAEVTDLQGAVVYLASMEYIGYNEKPATEPGAVICTPAGMLVNVTINHVPWLASPIPEPL